MKRTSHRGALLASGCLIGAGLGGFLDGIVLHQILQWHHLLSSRIPPTDLVSIKVNMFWDGVFHLLTWIMTGAGLAVLWRHGQHRGAGATRLFTGSLALGWGLFNLIEGAVDHQILGLHHVHPGSDELAWDVGFLLFGAALALGGAAMIRAGRSREIGRPSNASRGPDGRVLTPQPGSE